MTKWRQRSLPLKHKYQWSGPHSGLGAMFCAQIQAGVQVYLIHTAQPGATCSSGSWGDIFKPWAVGAWERPKSSMVELQGEGNSAN